MMPKPVIKGICIFLAILMVLSVGAIIIQVIAADPSAVQTYISPVTGDNDADYIIPIGIVVFAVLALVVCLVIPKLKKKDSAEKETE